MPGISPCSKTRMRSRAHVRAWLAAPAALPTHCRLKMPQTHRSNHERSRNRRQRPSLQRARRRSSAAPRRCCRSSGATTSTSRPTNRPRSQSLRGFDDCYTDIVDYIVRCTHKIWDERDVGLIYTHYTHNAVLYGTMGTLYTREDVVRDTIQRLVSLPERRGMATQVIWRGNDEDGFYTSHLVTGSGRHTQFGHYGEPTGRTFVSRTIADCMVYENKIYREWVVADTMAIIKQLGLDPHAFAERFAREQFEKGFTNLDIGENRRLLGQYPPEAEADLSLAHNPLEEETLRWLHEVYNKRMFGKIKRCLCADRAVARAADEGALRSGGGAAPDHGARRLDPGLRLRAPAHLLGPLRGRRRQGRRALDHGRPPHRLRPPRRSPPASACR